ncbi:hypothetical protein Tco_1214665 [Tanacetum coccineum]
MTESSNPTQIPSPLDVTPKEELVTLDKPKSPNPFLPTDQVEFTFDEITFTTNNEGDYLSVLVDKTKSAGDGLKTAHTDSGTNEESKADEISRKIKLEDLSDLMKDTRSTFFTPDSPQDELIIVLDESEEEETKKDKDTHTTSHDVPEDTSVPHLSSPKLAQI